MPVVDIRKDPQALTMTVVAQFAEMNRHCWSGPIEAYIYNEFADALREGFRL